jgi:hypothetical protein
MQNLKIRRMAEGLALAAYPKWQRTGIRVMNHAFDQDGQHIELLTIIDKKGAVCVYQHFPENKNLGVILPAAVTKLVANDKASRHGLHRGR